MRGIMCVPIWIYSSFMLITIVRLYLISYTKFQSFQLSNELKIWPICHSKRLTYTVVPVTASSSSQAFKKIPTTICRITQPEKVGALPTDSPKWRLCDIMYLTGIKYLPSRKPETFQMLTNDAKRRKPKVWEKSEKVNSLDITFCH